MKKIILLLPLIMLMNSLSAQESKTYFDNGNLKSIGNLFVNNKSGEWKFYYESGELKTIGNFNNNGEPIDEWTTYFKNGKIGEVGKFNNGSKTGIWKTYYDNGKLFEIGEFENDQKIGEWKTYSKDGELISNDSFSKPETVIPFRFVETPPVILSCEKADNKRKCTSKKFANIIAKNFNPDVFSEIKDDVEIPRKVRIGFNINKSGLINNIKVSKVPSIVEIELKRVVKLIPKMNPGRNGDEIVTVSYDLILPFGF